MRNSFALLLWTLVIASLSAARAQTAIANKDSIRKMNRHDFISQGHHANELKLGTYVVVSTVLNEADAKLMIKEYLKLKCPEPAYGYVSNKKLWYLYFEGEDDIEKAKLIRDNYRKNKMFKDAWLLTVHQ